MAEKRKNSFVLYTDIRAPLELLSDEERGKLFMAILDYAERGDLPDFAGALQMAFSFIQASIDRNAEKWEQTRAKRAEAGSKGGKARQANQANATFAKQNKQTEANQANQAVSVPVPVNVPVSVPVIDISLSSDDDKGARVDYQKIVDSFNAVCQSLPRVQAVSDKRKKAMRAADKLLTDIGGFEALFAKVERSDFLTGRKGDWHGCGFDWILKPANLTKVMEGNYDNRASGAVPDYTDPDRYANMGWEE